MILKVYKIVFIQVQWYYLIFFNKSHCLVIGIFHVSHNITNIGDVFSWRFLLGGNKRMWWNENSLDLVFILGQLLVTLTGIIVHGHGDEPFVQYFNELWPNDPNFTIGSLLCLLCSLEKEPIKESQVLLKFEPQNTFFQQILQGSSHCSNVFKPTKKIVSVKSLSRKLL
jgi:hypothetical protein